MSASAPVNAGGHLEYRRFGPPGTGKSTSLARDVGHAVEKFGSAAVLVASYSKAAAIEIASKCDTIEPSHVGTLHAMGLRALGRPRVVDGRAVADWNTIAPAFRLGLKGKLDADDPLADVSDGTPTAGDEIRERYELLRARCVPRAMWRGDVAGFAAQWEEWKAENDLVDFGDMICRPLEECPVAPGAPTVGFFDEAQDFSAAEWALVRRWAGAMDYVVCVGDDDQSIYGFRGADPEAFLNPPLPDEQIRVLAQSYRVPATVHALASRWISRVRGRQPKEYRPRQENGETVQGAVRRPFVRLADREAVTAMVGRYAEDGRTVAILASCSYLLSGVVSELRRQGVPFHNPWRKSRGDWNPLTPGRGVSTADRLIAWLGPSRRADGSAWTLEELKRWSSIVASGGVLSPGAKSAIAKADVLSYADLVRWVPAETLAAGAAGDMPYLMRALLAAKAKAAEFPARVIERRGPDALESKPRVIVSTIHGAKGGQADVVILAPDLSRAGAEEWERGAASVRRLFYVGATRAREELVILEPNNGRMAVDL